MAAYNRIGIAKRRIAAIDLFELPYRYRKHTGKERWVSKEYPSGSNSNWPDMNCPDCERRGHPDRIVRWAEAGYVPGHRICPWCGSHFSLEQEGPLLWVLTRATFHTST